jgi:hypothetical protein
MKTKTHVKAGDHWSTCDDPTLFRNELDYK